MALPNWVTYTSGKCVLTLNGFANKLGTNEGNLEQRRLVEHGPRGSPRWRAGGRLGAEDGGGKTKGRREVAAIARATSGKQQRTPSCDARACAAPSLR